MRVDYWLEGKRQARTRTAPGNDTKDSVTQFSQITPTSVIITSEKLFEDITLNKLISHRYPMLTLIIFIIILTQHNLANIS